MTALAYLHALRVRRLARARGDRLAYAIADARIRGASVVIPPAVSR